MRSCPPSTCVQRHPATLPRPAACNLPPAVVAQLLAAAAGCSSCCGGGCGCSGAEGILEPAEEEALVGLTQRCQPYVTQARAQGPISFPFRFRLSAAAPGPSASAVRPAPAMLLASRNRPGARRAGRTALGGGRDAT